MHKSLKMLSICLVLTLLMLITVCLTAFAAEVGYITANGGLRMRTGPGTNYEVITTIPQGESVNIIGAENGWLEVTYQGSQGWVSGQYVSTRKVSETSRASTGERSTEGQKIVDFAKKYVGHRYVYGGSSPSGFDCSGLVSYTYKNFGYSMNRTASGQAGQGVYVSKANLVPGDLVFFNTYGGISHVGIYIGGGQMVHAANKKSGVKINSISDSYYGPRYVTARRIVR